MAQDVPDRAVRVHHSVLDADDLAVCIGRRYAFKGRVHCELLNRGMNDVYLVRDEAAHYVARCYRANWHRADDVDYEIGFLRYLDDRGVSVAPPVAGADGAYRFQIAAPEGVRETVVFRWANGTPLKRALNEDLSEKAGAALATLQVAGRNFAPRRRRKTDYVGLLSRELPELLRLLEYDAGLQEACREAGSRVVAALAELEGKLPFGPVHGDYHPGNVFVASDDGITILDFDNCGEGHLLEDVARWLWSARLAGIEARTNEGFLRGYEAVRPLEEEERRSLPALVAAQQQWYMGGLAANINAIGRGQFLANGFGAEAARLANYLREAGLD